MFQRLEDIRTVNSLIVHFDSLLGRLLRQVSNLIHRYQSHPAVHNLSMHPDSRLGADACGDSLSGRTGTSVSEEVSLLLMRMSAASRIISVRV